MSTSASFMAKSIPASAPTCAARFGGGDTVGVSGIRITRALAALLVAGAFALVAPAVAEAEQSPTRDVLVVSNNWAGTADLIDPETFSRLERINVIPDSEQRIAEIHADPVATGYFNLIRELIGEGHNQYVDDGFTSPDGRLVYFSRPSFADVVAINLKTEQIRLADEDRRLPRRPHGDLGRRPPAAGLGLDRAGHRRDRHAERGDHRPHPVGGLSAREQLLRRRQADLPREYRHRLHRHRRSASRLDQGRAGLRDRSTRARSRC